jgi:hypothetical protein
LIGLLEANHYQADPWKTRFPLCAAIPDDVDTCVAGDWGLPQGSTWSRNAGFGNAVWLEASDEVQQALAEIADNLDDAKPKDVFTDEQKGDMSVPKGSPVRAIPGFEPTDFSKIGIQKN